MHAVSYRSLACVAGGLVREKRLGRGKKRPPARKLSFFEFSVRQWTGKTDWLFTFGLSITESGKYESYLVQRIVTFLNEFIHPVKLNNRIE